MLSEEEKTEILKETTQYPYASENVFKIKIRSILIIRINPPNHRISTF